MQTTNYSHNQAPPKKRTFTPRSNTKKKKKRRLRIRRFTITTFALVLLAILFWGVAALSSIIFKVKKIEVIGNTRYSTEEILKAGNIKVGENLLLCKTSLAKEQIEKQCPYVETANIKKSLFGKLTFRLKETTPLGLFEHPLQEDASTQGQAKYIVVSPGKKALEFADQEMAEIPVIKGLETESVVLGSKVKFKNAELFGLAENIISSFKENGLSNITKIDLSNLNHITLNYKNKIDVLFGSVDDPKYKIDTAVNVIQELNEESGTLDLSIVSENGKSYFRPKT